MDRNEQLRHACDKSPNNTKEKVTQRIAAELSRHQERATSLDRIGIISLLIAAVTTAGSFSKIGTLWRGLLMGTTILTGVFSATSFSLAREESAQLKNKKIMLDIATATDQKQFVAFGAALDGSEKDVDRALKWSKRLEQEAAQRILAKSR